MNLALNDTYNKTLNNGLLSKFTHVLGFTYYNLMLYIKYTCKLVTKRPIKHTIKTYI